MARILSSVKVIANVMGGKKWFTQPPPAKRESLFKLRKIAFLCLILVGLTTQNLKAQIDITIGTGTSGNTWDYNGYPCPFQDYYEAARMQFLYRASELQAAGMGPGNIGAIKFTVNGLNGFSGDIDQFTVKLGGTSTSSLSETKWESNTGNINYGPVEYLPVDGVNTLVFTSPFVWNGTDNIIVEICTGDPTNLIGVFGSRSPTVTWTTGLSFNASHTYKSDNLGNLCGTSETNNSGSLTTRPNIIFSYTPAAACSGKPNAGTAVSNNASACANTSFTLSTTGTTIASGLSFKWQNSTDNVSWSDVAGGTSATLTTSQTVSNYYRAIVGCSGQFDTSTAVMVSTPALINGAFTINSAVATGSGNFQTIAEAFDYIKCGINGPVIFNVAPGSGPYNEQIMIPQIGGASATNTITINGNGATLSFTANTSANRTGIYLNGADHIIIDSLKINGAAGTYAWGILLSNGADSNIIRKCTINLNTSSSSSDFLPIVFSGSVTSVYAQGNNGNYNLIEKNTLVGGYSGIYMYGNTSNYNKGNVASDNAITDSYSYATYVYGQESAVISGNDITRPTRITSGTVSACYLSYSVGALIEKNRVHNLFGSAHTDNSTIYLFYIDYADGTVALPNKVINNLVYDISFNGTIYGLYNSSSDYTKYYHNSLVFNDATATSGAVYGIYQTNTATGVDFRNNLIYITRTGSGVKRCIYLSTTTSSVTSNNNAFYMAPLSSSNYVGQFGTTSYASMNDWITANSGAYDGASVFDNPMFLNTLGNEFKPSSATINNIGADLGVATDINGLARTATPDPGAIEFELDPCTGTPLPGSAVTTDAAPCANATFTLNLEGNSIGAGQTYQWQWSTDDANWTNIGSAKLSPLYNTSQTSSHFYRAEVKCNGGTAAYSTSIFIEKPDLGAAYTINKNLPTGGTNFASFTEAMSALKCGITGPVTFTVEPFSGPYNEQVTIPTIPGTSSTNTVTILGNGNTINFTATESANPAAFVLNGSDHVTIDSLIIDASSGTNYGWGMLLTNQADSNVIRNCNIITSIASTSTGHCGILMNSSTAFTDASGNNANYNLIENNTIVGGYYGIQCQGNYSPSYNVGNRVIGNILQDQYYTAIYMSGEKQAVVSKNDISAENRTSFLGGFGVYVTSCGDSMLVEKNKVHNVFDAATTSYSSYNGIYITSSNGNATYPSRCENNLVHSVNNDNGGIYGMNISANNWNVYHNTIILDKTTAGTTSATYGVYASGTGINIKNNIVSVSRGGAGNKYCLYLSGGHTGAINSNDWYMNSANGSNYVAYKNVGYSDLVSWKASNAGIYDQASRSVDPMFQQLSPGDFFPSEPTINNIGENLGVMTDILDSARTATPDPGAYEFQLPACTDSPKPGIVNTVTDVCPSNNFTLEVIGSSTGEGLTYQWQVSSDDANWTDLSSPSLVSLFTTSQLTTSFYRALVKCGSGTAVPTPSVLVNSPGLAPAGTYTIDNNLPTGGGNFQNFGDAVNFITCGIAGPITFNVAANSGPYIEQVTIPAIGGSSAINTVTWNGNGTTINYAANDAATRGVVTLNGADHMVFDSLVIDASAGTYGYGFLLTNRADSNIIRKCTVLNEKAISKGDHAGIIMSGGTGTLAAGNGGNGNLFERNDITGGYYGIVMYGSTTDTSKYNSAVNNVIKDCYYSGLYTSYTQFTTFSGNDISRPTRTNAGSETVYISSNFGGILVEKNRVHNLQDAVTGKSTIYGFDLQGSGTSQFPNRFENNIMYNINNGNSYCYGVYATGSQYWTIAHNTILLDDATATSGNTYGMYAYGTQVKIYNNIVSITRGGTGDKYCLYANFPGPSASNNNVLYINSPAGNNSIGYYISSFTNLANWKTANGGAWDQNSMSVDPLFTDPSNGNLAPQQASIFQAGNGLTAVATDILGVSRSLATPTPGAYEMSVGLPVTVLNIDATRSAADVKLNWATLTEINNRGFEVERSTDGRSFHKVGYVGSKAANGNSNLKLGYEFLDVAAPGSELYYRLKQVDMNGRTQNSNVVRVKAIGNGKFDIISLYPNPAHNAASINLLMSAEASGKLTLLVTDVAGKILLQQPATMAQGSNNLSLKVSSLPAGTYFLRAICSDGCQSTVKKFIIQ